MKTNLPNASQLRTNHGAIVATKKTDASATPVNDGFPAFHRRYQAHNPDAGKNEISEVLVSAATPHSKPNPIHGVRRLSSSSSRVNQKITASNKAARLVSHTQRVDQYITIGNNAQPHAPHIATFPLKHFRAIRKIGMHVSAEKTLLIVSKINAEACV